METLHPEGARARLFGLLSYAVAPVIYSLAVPILLLDVWLTAYQWICFAVYGIPRVPRRQYILLDRHRLPGLSGLDRLNCNYCGYANGVLAYAREIAARTEQYWCPLQHARRPRGAHGRYGKFIPHGDVDALAERRQALREDLLNADQDAG